MSRGIGVTAQYCTFFLDNLFVGIEVEKVQEVIRYLDRTHVPLAPDVVRGLINLRGQIVLALDLRRQLGLPDWSYGKKPMNVVVRSDEGAVSLLVDEIGDVIAVSSGDFERLPDTLTGQARSLIRGAFKLDGRLLLVLNTDKVLSF